jgi:hypothetical protein
MDAAKDKFKQTLGELALEGARDRVQVGGLASQVNRTGSMLAKNKSLSQKNTFLEKLLRRAT